MLRGLARVNAEEFGASLGGLLSLAVRFAGGLRQQGETVFAVLLQDLNALNRASGGAHLLYEIPVHFSVRGFVRFAGGGRGRGGAAGAGALTTPTAFLGSILVKTSLAVGTTSVLFADVLAVDEHVHFPYSVLKGSLLFLKEFTFGSNGPCSVKLVDVTDDEVLRGR